jgi:hypothetical protein
LAGLYLFGAISRSQRIGRLVAAGLAAVALYVPWLVYAGNTIRARLSTGQAAGTDPIAGTFKYLKPTLGGLAFAYNSGQIAVVTLAVVLVLGLVVGVSSWADVRKLLLPVIVVGISVLGIAYGAQAAYWFAVRHLVPVSLFLGLALAWSLDALATRWRPLLLLALAALVVVYWPTSSRFVYAKTLEVVDPFDPTADHRYLADHAAPADLVFFNILSKAGWYENQRRPGDPAWSYAMRWDPVVEPMPRLTARIGQAALTHHRLWFVLYKGTYGPNAPLKDWLDATCFPAGGGWQEDTLFLAYAVPGSTWTETGRDDRFGLAIHLVGARFTPTATSGDVAAVELRWQAGQPVPVDYKVFVHLTDDAGHLVAQHDGMPAGDTRPTTTWQPGEIVSDRHGLFLPQPGQPRPVRLHLRVGLYDPNTGQRLHMPDNGDQVELGTITVSLIP